MSSPPPRHLDPSEIAVVGAGGAGNNVVNRINAIDARGIRTIALNTDKQHLQMVEAGTKLLVGKSLTRGLGAGGDPSMGRRATEMAQGTITEELEGAELVLVVAGMGGGTGTGAAPVVASIAGDTAALVLGVVTSPFETERARLEHAQEGIETLAPETDTTFVLDINQLLDYSPDLAIGKAFSVMDQLIAEAIRSLVPGVTGESILEDGFDDIRSACSESSIGTLLIGESDSESERLDALVTDVIQHPFLDVDRSAISSGLVQVAAGPELTDERARRIVDRVRTELDLEPARSPAVAYSDPERTDRTTVQVLVTDVR